MVLWFPTLAAKSVVPSSEPFALPVVAGVSAEVYCTTVACVGSTARFSVTVGGTTDYGVVWKKVDGALSAPNEVYFQLKEVKLSDAGKYYCEITVNGAGGGLVYSDTTELTVFEYPQVSITTPLDQSSVCRGETVTLKAVNQKSGQTGVLYRWTGENIADSYAASTIAHPRSSGSYIVTASHKGCIDKDTVNFSMLPIAMSEIPACLYVVTGDSIEIRTMNDPNYTYEWKKDGGAVSIKSFISLKISESTLISLKTGYKGNSCYSYDTCQVILRNMNTTAWKGGEEDGFSRKELPIRIHIAEKEVIACCYDTARLQVDMLNGSDLYRYEWRKQGDKKIVSRDALFFLDCKSEAESGYYICSVSPYFSDKDTEILRDSVNVIVHPIPEVVLSGVPDTSVCYGVHFTMKAVVSGVSDVVYAWSGRDFIGATDQATVTVKPEADERYILTVTTKNGCYCQKNIPISLNKPRISIPGAIYSVSGKQISLVAAKNKGAILDWYIDDVGAGSAIDTLKQVFTKSALISVKATERGCSLTDTCRVFHRDIKDLVGGDDDGWTEKLPIPPVRLQNKNISVCRGGDVALIVNVATYGVYTKEWWKIDGGKSLGEGDTLKLSKVEKGNAGRYYCRVLDLKETDPAKKYIYSDTATLTIVSGPVIDVNVPDILCFGLQTKIDASLTDTAREADDIWHYKWSGEGIVSGEDTYTVTVSPSKSTYYKLSVSNAAGCQDDTLVQVRVCKPYLNIPSTRMMKAGEVLCIIPKKSAAGNKLDWWIDGTQKLQGKDTFSMQIDTSCIVVSTMTGEHNCEMRDTCIVFARQTEIFEGGDEDGWMESDAQTSIKLKRKEIVACLGAPTSFEVIIAGTGLYKTRWLKVNGDSIGNNPICVIPKLKLTDAGRYVCEVTDLRKLVNRVYTDTLVLSVTSGPVITIDCPDSVRRMCYGAQLEIDASKTEESKEKPECVYHYVWTGQGIVDGGNTTRVTISPERNEVYVLTVTDENKCQDQDTVNITVYKPTIDILSSLMVAEGDKVEALAPKKPVGAKLDWYQSGVKKATDQDQYTPVITSNDRIVVTMLHEKCSTADSCDVFYRRKKTYFGGNDDGWYESSAVSTVRLKAKDLAICRGQEANLEVIISGCGVYKLQWRYLDGGDVVLENNGSSVCKIPDFSKAQEGRYYCVVINLNQPEGPERYTYSDTAMVKMKMGPIAKISEPIEGKVICRGTSFTLDASGMELDKDPADVYHYQWTGVGTILNATTATATAIAEGTQFKLTVTNDLGCESVAEVNIKTTETFVTIPTTAYLPKPDILTLIPVMPTGSSVVWTIGKIAGGTADTARLKIEDSGLVSVILTDKLGCKAYDTCQVFVRNVAAFNGNDDDGFFESLEPANIKVTEKNPIYCRGQQGRLDVTLQGVSLYSYMWKKKEDALFQFMGKQLTIDSCTVSDEGHYYCVVTDLRQTDINKKIQVSDTAVVTVYSGPLAKINAPIEGAEYCSGTEIVLDASKTEETNEGGLIYQYHWEGENIFEGIDSKQAKAKLGVKSTYIVAVTSGNCVTYDTIELKIIAPSIVLPNTLYAMEGEQVELTPEKPKGAILDWYLYGKLIENSPHADTGRFKLTMDGDIVVAMDYAKCMVMDTTHVYVKKKALYAGGDDDGWNESRTVPTAQVNMRYQEICRGNTIRMEAFVHGYDFYQYEWWKSGGLLPAGNDKILTIPKGQMSDKGKYYCIITDIRQTIISKRYFSTDTAEINVIPGPLATIGKPVDGEKVCNGNLILLDASDTEKFKWSASDVYTYKWSGDGLQSGVNAMKATALPRYNGSYVVEVTDGRCVNRDTVRLKIEQPRILLPSTKYLVSPHLSVSYEPSNANGGQINWYLDGKKEFTNQDRAEFTLTKDAVVVAELIENGCFGYDTSHIFVKDMIYLGGDNDGWNDAQMQMRVKQIYPQQTVCRGQQMLLDLNIFGNGIFRYQWRKAGSMEVISTEKILKTMAVSGKYYCTVIDLADPDKMRAQHISDTAVVTIIPGPIAEISSPMDNFEICKGEAINLDGSATDNNKVTPSDVYTYIWRGENILSGENAVKSKVRPSKSGMYILTAEGQGCSSSDTIHINVLAPEIRISSNLYNAMEETFVFVPEKSEGGALNWFRDGSLVASAQDTGKIYMNESGIVTVELVQNTCRAYDTCHVFIKDPRPYTGGGNNDGFFVNPDRFYIKYFDSTSYVCAGSPAHYEVYVVGHDIYRYSWKKKRFGLADLEVSKQAVLDILNCQRENDGEYYCEITELSTGTVLKSSVVSLHVIDAPVAKIDPITIASVCKGTSQVLRADKTGLSTSGNYQFVWAGPFINGMNTGDQVRIQPQQTSLYTLTISDRGCAAVDTAQISVLNPHLMIPQAYRVFQGDGISVKAEVAAGAVVNWMVNGNPYRNKNPLVITNVSESMKVVASLDGECVVKDSAMIYVRTKLPYAGGDEDGFAMPNFTPNIIEQSEPVAGCGVDTTTLFVKVLEDPKLTYEYRWQKYSKDAGEFVNYTSDGANVTGYSTSRLHFDPIMLKDEGRYRCLVKNSYGYTTGREVSLVKGNIPQIIGHMNDLRKCEHDSAQFIVNAIVPGGGVSMSYRWYRASGEDRFAQIQGANMDKKFYTITDLAKNDQGFYMVEVYNLCGQTYDTTTLDVMSKPVVISQTLDSVVCVGSTATFGGKLAGGAPYGVKLIQVEPIGGGKYKDKRVLFTANSQTGVISYTIDYVSNKDDGYYQWRLLNSCDTSRGKVMRLMVENPPVFVYQKVDTLICEGSTYVMSGLATAAIQENVCYYWEKDGVRLSTTTNTLEISSMSKVNEGRYVCYAYSSCRAEAIKEYNIWMKQKSNIVLQPTLRPSYCEGIAVQLSVSVKDPADVIGYQWYRNSSIVNEEAHRISGVTSPLLKIDTLRASDEGAYKVIVTNSCGTVSSNEVQLLIDLMPRFGKTLAGQDAFLCAGGSRRLSVTASTGVGIAYTWTKNDVTLPGIMTGNLDLNNVNRTDTGTYCVSLANKCSQSLVRSCAKVDVISPLEYKVLGSGSYCSDAAGLEIKLSGFEKDAVYKLYRRSGVSGIADAMIKEVAGMDVVEGEALSFGIQTEGSYYVYAYQTRGGVTCYSIMLGDAVIVRNLIPNRFELVVSREYCKGNASGDLQLTNSDLNSKIEYTLEKVDGSSGSWGGYGAILIGTGKALEWYDVPVGTYRVIARNTVSTCLRVLDSTEVKIRELPSVMNVFAVGGDSTVCEGMTPDVAIALSGFETGTVYSLLKNGENTGKTITGEPLEWSGLDDGHYLVRAENQWGCQKEFGKINVTLKPAPVRFNLLGGKIFCQNDTGKDTLTLSGSSEKVRYDLFMTGQIGAVGSCYGTGNALEYVIDKRAGEYYLMATDTVFDCVAEMLNRRDIPASMLSLSAQKLNSEYNAAIQLRIGVNGQIGTLSYQWEPVGMLKSLEEATKANPETKILTRGTKYQVTVSDTVCTTSAYVEVAITNGQLVADILKEDCFTIVDSMVVCEGGKVNLCSYASDGTANSLDYRWMDGSSTVLGFDPTLKDYEMSVSNWIYLQVISGSQSVRDSVWVEIGKLPVKPILNVPAKWCVVENERVECKVVNAQPDVLYTLEFSDGNFVYRSTGMEVLSHSSDPVIFPIDFSSTKIGYYRVKAEKKYKGKVLCSAYSSVFEMRPGSIKFNTLGGGHFCEYHSIDTIGIVSSEVNIYYKLMRKVSNSSYSQLAVKKGSGSVLKFSGAFGAGDYIIVAERDVCADTMKGIVEIRYNTSPQIGSLIGLGVHCEGDSTLIGITAAEDQVVYTLLRDTTGLQPITEAEVSGQKGLVHFGKFDRAGKYYVRAQRIGSCDTIFEGITILHAPNPVAVDGKGEYCSADKKANVLIKLHRAEPRVVYDLCHLTQESVGVFGDQRADTVYYAGALVAGRYVVKGTLGNCQRVMADTVEVIKHINPEIKAVPGVGNYCENGDSLQIGLMAANANVSYTLYRDTVGKLGIKEAVVAGKEGTFEFGRFILKGEYYIQAENIQTKCRSELRGINMIRSPKSIAVKGQGSYCESEGSVKTQLKIFEAEKDVLYHLSRLKGDSIGVFGQPNKDTLFCTETLTGGRYIVTGTLGLCQKVMKDTINIEMKPTPRIGTFIGVGDHCEIEGKVNIRIMGAEESILYTLYRDSVGRTGILEKKDLTGNGPLDFGSYTKIGNYYIYALNPTTQCDTIYRGVNILRSPKIVKVAGSDSYCESAGALNAKLVLSGIESDVTYLLTGLVGDTLGVFDRLHIDTLHYDGKLVAGKYTVTAAYEGCRLEMKDTVKVGMIESPVIKTLIGEGSYCESDGVFPLMIGINPGQVGVEYTLLRDSIGHLRIPESDIKTGVGEIIFGQHYVNIGKYYVEATQLASGCVTTFGDVKITKAPEEVDVIGGGSVCEGDSVTVTLKNVDPLMNYVLLDARGTTIAFTNMVGNDYVFKGILGTGTYWVKALSGSCSRTMATTVKVSMIKKPQIGELLGKGTWCQDQCPMIGIGKREGNVVYTLHRDSVGVDYEMAQLTGTENRMFGTFCEVGSYSVSANDTLHKCSAIFDGITVLQSPENIQITGGGDYCEGVNGVVVDVKVFKAEKNITYKLYSPEDVAIANLGNSVDDTLYYSGKLTNGVYRVKAISATCTTVLTGKVNVTKHPLPGVGSIKGNGLFCESDGKQIFGITNGEKNIIYTLLRDSAGMIKEECRISQVGAFDFGHYDLAGRYYIEAVDTLTGCEKSYELAVIQVAPKDVNVVGKSAYCDGTEADVMKVKVFSVENGIQYSLYGPSNNLLAEITNVNKDTLSYSAKLTVGVYRVKATNGICTRVLTTPVEVIQNKLPGIGVVIGAGQHCESEGTVSLGITGGEKDVRYQLLRDSAGITYKEMEKTGVGEIVFGNYNYAGRYYIQTHNVITGCEKTYEAAIILRAPHHLTVTGGGDYCEGEGRVNVKVKIYPIQSDLSYYLYTKDGVLVADMGSLVADTLSYTGLLKAGEYVVKSTVGTCEVTMKDRVIVTEHLLPLSKYLLTPQEGCIGTELAMGVVSSQSGIRYELFKKVNDGNIQLKTAKGDGGNLIIGQIAESGNYYIQATDTLTGCNRSIEGEYVVKGHPEYYKITSSDSAYCEGEKGVSIGIAGTQRGINYVLQTLNNESGSFEDIPSKVIVGVGAGSGGVVREQLFNGWFKTGSYRIRTDYCNEMMPDTLTIREMALPKDIKFAVEGNGCEGNDVKMVLQNSEKGSQYVLFKDGVKFEADTLLGIGRDTSWTLINAKVGEYHIVADRGRCSRPLTDRIVVGTPVVFGELAGDFSLCANVKGEFILNTWETGANYHLLDNANAILSTGLIQDGHIVFKDVEHREAYYVMGELGSCQTRKGPYQLTTISLPPLDTVQLVAGDCEIDEQVSITLKNLQAAYVYTLENRSMLSADIIRGYTGDSVYTQKRLGEYCLKVKDETTGCESASKCKHIREALPMDSIAGDLVYCEGTIGTRLRLSDVSYQVIYQIYTAKGDLMDQVLYPEKNFTSQYEAGKYILYKERTGVTGGCFSRDTFEIVKGKYPLKRLQISTGIEDTLCAGNENRITIKNAEKQVVYILSKINAGNQDTIQGFGVDKSFKPIRQDGIYKITAKSYGICEMKYDTTILVHPLPTAINVQGCAYCYEPNLGVGDGGCQIYADGMKTQVKYRLWNDVEVDQMTGQNSGYFKTVPAGKYKIIGETAVGCVDTVATAIIKAYARPRKFTVGTPSGVNCGQNLAITTIDGSQSDSVEYLLYLNDYTLVAGPVKTANSYNVVFDRQVAEGEYKIYARMIGAENCGTWMNGSVYLSNKLITGELIAEGGFCQGETGKGFKLSLKSSVPGWRYFVTTGVISTDTLYGKSGSMLQWDQINKGYIGEGRYFLCAMNTCQEVYQLDTVTLLPYALPQIFALAKGEDVLCIANEAGTEYSNSRSIELLGSESGFNYELTVTKENKTKILKSLSGTGSGINFGECPQDGMFRVKSVNPNTGCSIYMDSVNIRTAFLMPFPGFKGNNDTCIRVGEPMVINLGIRLRRLPTVDYFLEVNGHYVDSLLGDQPTSLTYFKPQKEVGCYSIACRNYTYHHCVRKFVEEIRCLGLQPKQYALVTDANPANYVNGTLFLCAGDKTMVSLESSDLGVKYQLYRDGKLLIDKIILGTGDKIDLATITEPGLYEVMALNGCEAMMDSKLTVQIKQRPSLKIQKTYNYCEGTEGVNLQVLPITNIDYEYTLYRLNGNQLDYVEWVCGDATGQAVNFVKKQPFKAGIYVIKAIDLNNVGAVCPAYDTTIVTASAYPRRDSLSTPYSNYLCGNDSRELILSGSEKDALYTLLKREDPVYSILKQGTGTQLVFSVTDTGTYYVEARYDRSGNTCAGRMKGEVQFKNPRKINEYLLEGLVTDYCYRTPAAGSVKLTGSQTNVAYELYKDGVRTGSSKMGSESILTWTALDGLLCNEITNERPGINYSVMAFDSITKCSKPMPGIVTIKQENEPEYIPVQNKVESCFGDQVFINIVAEGCNLHYKWKKDGKELISTGDASYEIPVVAEQNVGWYECEISNGCGVVKSELIELKMYKGVMLDDKMKDKVVCSNGPEDVSLVSTAYADSYKWYRRGAPQNILSKTSILEIKGAMPLENSGEYICYAKNNNSCPGVSDTVALDFNKAPVQNFVFGSDTACLGSSHIIFAESTDTVSWIFNGSAIGVEGTELKLATLKRADEGLYSVRIANACEAITVPVQQLYVDSAYSVHRISPNEQRLCSGSNINLFVELSPNNRMIYKWQKNGMILSERTSTYTSPASLVEPNIKFTLTYGNKCKMVTQDMQVHIDRTIEYTPLPDKIAICTCLGLKDTALIIKHPVNMQADYKWFIKNGGVSTALNGQNKDTLRLPIRLTSNGYYYSQIENGCGLQNTNVTEVAIDTLPIIHRSSVKDQMACEGEGLKYTVEASGQHLHYRWTMKLRDHTEKHEEYSYVDYISSSMLLLPNITDLYDSCQIWCEVSNECGKLSTDTMLLRVNKKAYVTLVSDSVSICRGSQSEVDVQLVNGRLPWSFSYRKKDGVEIPISCTERIGKMLIDDAGDYVISRLSELNNCVLSPMNVPLHVSFRDETFAILSGNDTVCLGNPARAKLKVWGGVGPWSIEIKRLNDGKLSEEMEMINPLVIDTAGTYDLIFNNVKNETYIIGRVVDMGYGINCVTTGGGQAQITILQPPVVKFEPPLDDHIGTCDTIHLDSFLKPNLSNGTYTINGAAITADKKGFNAAPGIYTINYKVVLVEGCSGQASYTLQVDSLPVATILPRMENLCIGERTSVDINVRGAGPCVVQCSLSVWNWNGGLKTSSVKFSVKDIYSISVNDMDSVRYYTLVDITDRHGCVMKPNGELTAAVRTRRKPIFSVYAKHPVLTDSRWKNDVFSFGLLPADSIAFNTKVLAGIAPYKLEVTLKNALTEKHYFETDVFASEAIFFARDTGVYRFNVSDKYCSTYTIAPITRSIYSVNKLYFKIKAVLEGAYQEKIGRMNSQIPELPKLKHIVKWPATGGRKIIDWVNVELRKEKDSVLFARDTFLLLDDGNLIDVNGNEALSIIPENNEDVNTGCYFVLNHRHHLAIMTKNKWKLSKNPEMLETIDLTNSRNVYVKDGDIGKHLSLLGKINGQWLWGLCAGDINLNRIFTISNPTKTMLQVTDEEMRTPGYYLLDVNFNGIVEWPTAVLPGQLLQGTNEDAWMMYKNRGKYSEVPLLKIGK